MACSAGVVLRIRNVGICIKKTTSPLRGTPPQEENLLCDDRKIKFPSGQRGTQSATIKTSAPMAHNIALCSLRVAL